MSIANVGGVDVSSLHGPLVPVACFLHRIFPAGHYDNADELVNNRLFKPRNDCEPVSLFGEIDWEVVERSEDRNWRMQLQGWTVFHPIMNFFDTYNNKQAILNFFFELAWDWWRRYGEDPDDVTTSRMPESYAWYDMSVGFRALILAFFLNRIEALDLYVSPKDLDLLKKLSMKHVANLSNEKTFSLNNHGLFQIHGLMALLHMLPQNYGYAARVYALGRMEELCSAQFDQTGVHLEHSPHYHFYVTSTFEALVESGWYDESLAIVSTVTAARDKCKWLVDPLRRPICVGDSILTVQDTLKFPDEDGGNLVSNFDSSGYAVVRSSWNTSSEKASMLFLTAAYHSKSHKHRDCLSFDWFHQGKRIICDSGKYGYRSDKYRNYFLSNRAHNTVEIEGFDIIKLRPYGSGIRGIEQIDAGVYRISAALDFPAIKHVRNLYFKPGGWLIVEDDLSFVRSRSFVQWFHLDKDFAIARVENNTVCADDGVGRQLFIDCLDRDVALQMHYGDEDAMQGFLSEKDYQFCKAHAIGFKGNGSKRKIVTILSLGKADRENAFAHAVSYWGGICNGHELNDCGKIEPKRLLPNIAHNITLDREKLVLLVGESTYLVFEDGVPLTFYAKIRENAEKLIVLLPGATSRSRSHQDFQRYSWADDFPCCDVLAFTDPSIRQDNELSLGWFQNKSNSYGIDALSKLLNHLILMGGYNPESIMFFGSSGGGFVSLKLANYFPKSPVIAINPQMFLYNYSRQHYEKMLHFCYQGLSESEVMSKYKDRLSVDLDFATRKAPAYVFQNIHDTAHLNRHLKPLLGSMPADMYNETSINDKVINTGALNVIYYDDLEAGHTPPGKEKTVSMIRSVMQAIGF
ncbi:alginate lyase family protein [Vogesella indigofera]|uniref:alginate lyase family protein n=1 Tax=Vogesella indigofera TaxID=45465 RepID=UPI00234E384E|nr:alginate lyase family protein [Vogesella indigofera]MDC7710846.1 alginate lyase family protein [Vogesella indigofera]